MLKKRKGPTKMNSLPFMAKKKSSKSPSVAEEMAEGGEQADVVSTKGKVKTAKKLKGKMPAKAKGKLKKALVKVTVAIKPKGRNSSKKGY